MFRRSLLAAPLLTPLLSIVGCTRTPPVTVQTVVVFFTPDSAALDANADAAITQAAATAKARGNVTVHVRGFAAPDAGSAMFNESLSRTRAAAVMDALVTAGVPRIQINLETRGAVPFELMPMESRRVEIVIGT